MAGLRDKGNLEDWTLAGIGAAKGVFEGYVRPELTAKRGWLAVAALVTAYELAAPDGELLSEGYDRGLEKHKMALWAATLVTAGHLLNVIPMRADPYHQGLNAIKSMRR
jgi:hypothetical protein